MIGIIAYGVLCQVAVMWFVENMLMYTLGLWIGIVLALLSAYHMWWSLDRNLTVNADNEGGAKVFSTRSNLIRYAVIAIVFIILFKTEFCYPLAAFLGIMGLKIGAYLTPLIKKIVCKNK